MRKRLTAVLLSAAGLLTPVGAGTLETGGGTALVASRPAVATPADAPDATPLAATSGAVTALGEPETNAAVTFSETFDGAPTSPQPWNPPNWDVTIHSRDLATFDSLEPMAAGHGANCAGPPATHQITAYADAAFICRDHMMTAIKAEGYGVVYLTPNHKVDFGSGEAVIRFDMSTLRTAIRDWPDLWITPFEDNLQLPLENFYPDLNGPPRRALHVTAVDFNGGTAFRVERYDGFANTDLNGPTFDTYESALAAAGLAADAARRDTFELRVGNGRIKFGMPLYNIWWIDEPMAPLGWTNGVVQLGHHSYNPEKDCSGCTANTWHWDNVIISPARPFTILRGDRRDLRASNPTVAFAQGAPAGGYLRFAGIGNDVQVSFDGGASWAPALRQAVSIPFTDDRFASYWMPMPAGARTATFRGGASFYGVGPWVVRDVSIWADDGGSVTAPPLPVTSTYAPLNPARLLDTRAGGIVNPGATTALSVAGLSGVAIDAEAVVLNVTATGASNNGFVTVWPCGQAKPLASNLNFQPGRDVANAVMATVGAAGKVCLSAGAASTHLVVDVVGYYPAGSSYTAGNPARLLDTRPGATTADGAGAGGGVVGVGQTVEVTVLGRGGVPATATAAVLNVTATEAATNGFLTAWPCGEARPLASSLNFSNGRDVASAVVTKIGAGGKVCIAAGASPVHVVVDVNGYFPGGTPYRALTPVRLLDSRPGAVTGDGAQAGFGTPAAGGTTTLQVTGRAGVPADAAAVVLNVTSAGARAAGYLTAWPCGYSRPLASSLNYSAGRDVANTVVSSLGAGGTVCLYSGVAATDLVVDVVGYFPGEGATASFVATPGVSRLAALPPVTSSSYCDLSGLSHA